MSDSPVQLSTGDWRVILTRTWHAFRISQAYDIAGTLTYYGVLSIFPALLATLAAVGVFGSAEAGAGNVLQVVEDLGGSELAGAMQEPLEGLVDASYSGLAFVTGIVALLWAASGYLGSFGRAMNRIYGVEEGRPFWAMRPAMVGMSAVLVVLVSIAAVGLVVTGPVAESVARVFGWDERVVFWWDLLKLPVLAGIGIIVMALLYWVAPNVRRRHLRWFSVGAVAALLTWILATTLFGAYVFGLGQYERTYGVVGGVIAFLLWLWLSNLAMLFGAVLDTEVERARQLRAGVIAEEHLQLPLRDDRLITKNRGQLARDIRASAAMRPPTAVDGLVPSAEESSRG